VAKLAAADIFYSGLPLEGKIADALIRMGTFGKPVRIGSGLARDGGAGRSAGNAQN
jgi:hypothetical protein